MDQKGRLSVLERMLAQLTGIQPEEPATPQVAQVIATPQESQLSQLPDPSQRKLQLLQSMLSKLQGS